MAEFEFNIAMDIRAYGFVKVQAESAEAATELMTADFVADNFQPYGSGKDDLDYNHPAQIWCDGTFTEDGNDGGELSPFPVPDGEWVTRDPLKETAADLLAALKSVLPYALSRIQDMNETPDEHADKATLAYMAALRAIEKAEGSANAS